MLVPFDPEGLLLGMYPKEKNQNDALDLYIRWFTVDSFIRMKKMETTQIFLNWRMVKITVNP